VLLKEGSGSLFALIVHRLPSTELLHAIFGVPEHVWPLTTLVLVSWTIHFLRILNRALYELFEEETRGDLIGARTKTNLFAYVSALGRCYQELLRRRSRQVRYRPAEHGIL
jgi:hypothetical protein